MAFDLNALAGQKATTRVDYMGQSANVTYDPNYLTQTTVMKMQSGDEGFVEVFTNLVTDWDVKRGNRKVPITLEGLSGIPIVFLRAVIRAVQAHGGETVAGEDEPSNDG